MKLEKLLREQAHRLQKRFKDSNLMTTTEADANAALGSAFHILHQKAGAWAGFVEPQSGAMASSEVSFAVSC